MLILIILQLRVLTNNNKEFFDTAEEQINQGAEWHYVGKSPLDPNSKSIPAQMCTDGCDKPYILWKLKSDGKAGVVLANMSLSSNDLSEKKIRKELIRKD